MATTTQPLPVKERQALKTQVVEMMLKRAGASKQAIAKAALDRWAALNIGLLTPAEQKKYQAIIR